MIQSDIQRVSIEQLATVVAEVLGHLLRESESKFYADVTNAGVLTEDEALAVLDEQRQIIISELNPQFVKIFEELRAEGAGGGNKVQTELLESGAKLSLSETSTISRAQ
jgi:hypothetical protein